MKAAEDAAKPSTNRIACAYTPCIHPPTRVSSASGEPSSG
jgi:hypothetical protein